MHSAKPENINFQGQFRSLKSLVTLPPYAIIIE
jgi:hypothetical protein